MGTSRELHLELLDKRSHILVRDDSTLILLDTEDRLIDVDLEVTLHLTLTAETPAGLDLLACEVRLLGVENLTAAFEHLNLTLAARGLTTAGRGQEDTVLIERGHQRGTLGNVDGTVAVDFNIHIA